MPDAAVPLLNFRWHLPGLLASAGKPSRPEHLAWIRKQHFRAVLSLEPIPDAVARGLAALGIDHLLLEIEDEGFDPDALDAGTWERFASFVRVHLAAGEPVLVHCSAGIRRSATLCERYAQEHDAR